MGWEKEPWYVNTSNSPAPWKEPQTQLFLMFLLCVCQYKLSDQYPWKAEAAKIEMIHFQMQINISGEKNPNIIYPSSSAWIPKIKIEGK